MTDQRKMEIIKALAYGETAQEGFPYTVNWPVMPAGNGGTT